MALGRLGRLQAGALLDGQCFLAPVEQHQHATLKSESVVVLLELLEPFGEGGKGVRLAVWEPGRATPRLPDISKVLGAAYRGWLLAEDPLLRPLEQDPTLV
jgi:hypothetical protein